MRGPGAVALLVVLSTLLCLPLAWGQQTPARSRIGYLCPAGGQQGTSFEVMVGGKSILRAKDVVISGSGVTGKVLDAYPVAKLPSQEERQALRKAVTDAYARLQQGTPVPQGGFPLPEGLPHLPLLNRLTNPTAEDLQRITYEYMTPRQFIRPVEAISEVVLVQVTIAPKAAPGTRELRLASPMGLSNPMCFEVGTLPETLELEPNDPDRKPTEKPLSLPVVLNGQIDAGDIDRFRFTAQSGQKLVLASEVRRLVPYMADAVPGWFQAVVTVYDAAGNKLQSSSSNSFEQDPVMVLPVERTGEYTVEIRDALYRGRKDFVYRLSLSDGPFVTGIFPLGAREGSTTVAHLQGWNLPTDTVTLDTTPGPEAVREITSLGGRPLVLPVRYAVGTLPEIQEQEPNDTLETAQTIALPQVVNGILGKPGEVEEDVFRFTGTKDQQIVAQVIARQLDSPLDALLQLCDSTGRVLQTEDDAPAFNVGLETHHADACLQYTLPADGTYYLKLSDTTRQGGPNFAYRLRVSAPQPDFALYCYPSGLSGLGGQSALMHVVAVRKEGFDGEIRLQVAKSPEGVALESATIPAGQEEIVCTLQLPDMPLLQPLPVVLEGEAQIGAETVRRRVIPAEGWEQAFAYQHLVPAQELLVSTGPGRNWAPRYRPAETGARVTLTAGETTAVRFLAPQRRQTREYTFGLVDSPAGITLAESQVSEGTLTLQIKVAPELAQQAGLSGNLILEMRTSVQPPQPDQKAPKRPAMSVPVGYLPALPYQVVGK